MTNSLHSASISSIGAHTIASLVRGMLENNEILSQSLVQSRIHNLDKDKRTARTFSKGEWDTDDNIEDMSDL